MTEDDNSRAAVRPKWGDVQPKPVMKFKHDVPVESRTAEEAFPDGVSAKALVLLSLPWFISIGVMSVAVLVYFWVHPWPDAFTESVLAIIVFGAGGTGGSMTFNRLYKYRVTHGTNA